MSKFEQIDFSTLIWVKKELDTTLGKARSALEEYVENPEDENQLQFCATYLHQVQGTLKMVELYGAAMVAEEMEQVVNRLIDGKIDSEKDAFDILIKGIILLPDYLERIQSGYKDIPMVLLPLVNDLRTVKGDSLLSESALFNPDLSLGVPESKISNSFQLSENQLSQVINKIRSAYQICLLNWLKGVNVDDNLKKIQIIFDKLKTVLLEVEQKQLFWVAGGLFEALISGSLEQSVTVKQLSARIDQAIKSILANESDSVEFLSELTKNMLYYVALATGNNRRVTEIQSFFRLSDYISDDKELEGAQSSLSGRNRELLESVSSVIKEDLMAIQESLDLYTRKETPEISDLEDLISSLNKISDTLGLIGVGIARSKIKDDIQLLQNSIDSGSVADEDTIMHVAETLLFVDSSLDENIMLLGETKESSESEDDDNIIPAAEMKKVLDTLARESISNLQKIKHNFIQFIEEPWNKDFIKSSPELLSQISGALKMSGFNEVADEVDKIKKYTSKYMLESEYKPSVDQLNLLAESIASLEYYLEYMSEGVKGDQRILDLAKKNIESLFETADQIPESTETLENTKSDKEDIDYELELSFEEEDNANEEDSSAEDVEVSEDMTEIDYEELIDESDDSELEGALDEYDISEAESSEELYVRFGEETDSDIKEVFLEEFEEELENMSSIFPKWYSAPEDNKNLLSDIRRIYHTLKGSGRLVGSDAIGDYSWKIEEMTNAVLNGSKDLNDSYMLVMQKSNELLPQLFEALKNGGVVPEGYFEIISATEKVMKNQEVNDSHFEQSNDIEVEEKVNVTDTIEIGDEYLEQSEEEIDDKEAVEVTTDLLSEDKESETEENNDLTVDPVFVEILQQEVKGHLDEISKFVSNSRETNDYTVTESFIRVVHTLNGAANMASVKSIVEITSPLEMSAKLSRELTTPFNSEIIGKIEEFIKESKNIMENLSSNSLESVNSGLLSNYFNDLLKQLEAEKEAADITSDDFDLSQFIDDSNESVSDEADSSLDLTEYDMSQFVDDSEDDNSDDAFDFEFDIGEDSSEKTENDINFEDIENEDSDLISTDYDLVTETSEPEENLVQSSDDQTDNDTDLEIETVNEDDIENIQVSEIKQTDDNEELSEDSEELSEEVPVKREFSYKNISIQEDKIKAYTEKSKSQESDGSENKDVFELEKTDLNEEVVNNEPEVSGVDDILDLSDIDFGNEISTATDNDSEFDYDDSQENIIQDDNIESVEEKQSLVDKELENSDSVEISESNLSEETDTDELEKVSEEISPDNEVEKETSSFDVPEVIESAQNDINEFDEELIEIFKEEADDILDRTEHVLTELEENPDDKSSILALQRDLHTLKGGARMAGLENIGELGHVLESLLENIGEDNKKVEGDILATIQSSFDMLNKMKESDDYGQSFDISSIVEKVKSLIGGADVSIPEESRFDQSHFAELEIEPVEESIDVVDEKEGTVQTVKKQSNVLSGNQIKVNSELLDNLVNYAGEVSIYRSRLEQEIGSFRVNLSELGNTVARIREQLRKLDAETEAQIISTFQTDEDEEGFDPLEMDRFSQLQQLSRSLVESVSDLSSIHSYLDDVARTSDSLLSQQSRVNTDLQEGLMETRLVSFNSIVPRLRRLVRTTSNELSKPARLDVSGAEDEMDKTVLEGVIAPLEHMLRNCLAHGIEKDRKSIGKPDKGNVTIDVRREATEVVISVTDDGAGINRKKVKELAIERGLLEENAVISDENIDRLILNSGFSTAEEVSKLAGRGVGMDVVSNQINLLGGSLDIVSEPGKGTRFNIRLPYTLALSSALLVEISETIYAIPVSGLEGIIRMSYPDYQDKVKNQDFSYEYANEDYQIHELNKLLDIESEVVIENNQIPLVMIRSGSSGVALRVDRILGSREIVVKTVGSQISSVPGIYGATVLGDGKVVLILDIIPLSRAYMRKLEMQEGTVQVAIQEELEKDPVIMIVDDSITMRKVGERILRRNSYDVVTAKDGLDALEKLKETVPDAMLLDIEMPRMDGYELAIEMKKEQRYSQVPIIMITSRTGEKHRQRAMDLGVDRYLGKPYQEADLLENIRELIEEKE